MISKMLFDWEFIGDFNGFLYARKNANNLYVVEIYKYAIGEYEVSLFPHNLCENEEECRKIANSFRTHSWLFSNKHSAHEAADRFLKDIGCKFIPKKAKVFV